MIGSRYECQCCGRIARIIDEYNDGFAYCFEGEGFNERWISAENIILKFRPIGGDKADTLKALQASVK